MNKLSLVIFITLLVTQIMCAQNDFSQNKGKNGEVNWATQYVTATGKVVVDMKSYPNKVQAEMMAEKGATAIAQRNLLEIVKGMQITSSTKGRTKKVNSVEYFMTENDKISTKINGVLKNATKVGKTKFENGYAVVTMQAPIYQGNSIASSVAKEKNIRKTKPYQTMLIYYFVVQTKKHKQLIFPKIYDKKGKLLFDFEDIYQKDVNNFPTTEQLTNSELEKFKKDKNIQIINLKEDKKGNFRYYDKELKWAKIKTEAINGKKFKIFILK